MSGSSSSGSELITNGDFSLGNNEFGTGYSYGDCTLETHYNVLVSANTCHGAWTGNDHTNPGVGQFMAVNGATSAGVTVWQQTLPVATNQFYRFTGWTSSVYPSSPAVLSISINGATVGSVTAPSSVNTWVPFSIIWVSGSSASATLRIVDANLNGGGNDFGLDDLSFKALTLGAAANLVCEDFHGPSLSSKWLVSSNGGNVTFNSQGVTLASSGGQFPYVRGAWPLVPAGDFSLAFKLKYNSVTGRGTGIHWGVATPSGTSDECTGESVPGFRVWQDGTSAGLRAAAGLTDPCTEVNSALAAGSDLLWHRYEFSRLGSAYTLQVDGVPKANWTEPYGNNFPLDLWFGSPVNVGSSGAWTSFTLDSIRVVAYDDAPASVSLSDFSDVSGLAMIGAAAQSGTALRLVPASGTQVGATFWAQPLPVAAFSSDFRFRISNAGGVGGGADGLTFCVRGSGSRVPGPAGGNLGYTGVTPSVAVEVDIFQNGEFGDPNANHVGIDVNGSMTSSPVAVDPVGAGVSLKDGSIYHVWVDYDGSTITAAIASDGQSKPAPILSKTLCLPFALGVVGFTAATASGYANHDIISWNYTPLSVGRMITGQVTAFTIDGPSEMSPTLHALPGARVGFESLGHLHPASGTSASDGGFSFPQPLVASDLLGCELENDTLRVVDARLLSLACDSTPVLESAVSNCSGATFQWQSADAEATSALRLAQTYLRDYWVFGLTRPPTGKLTINTSDLSNDVLNKGGAQAGVSLDVSGSSSLSFAPGYAEFGSTVRHEFSHWMIAHAAGGLALRQGDQHIETVEAGGLDEGLADFFAVAYNGDPKIYAPPNPNSAVFIRRDLAPPLPYKYYVCGSDRSSSPYYYAKVIGGALWQIRTTLLSSTALSHFAIERWVYDAIGGFASSTAVPGRTLNAFRHYLIEQTALGQTNITLINKAFADHNVVDAPAQGCGKVPTILQVERTLHLGQSDWRIVWTNVVGAARYRVFKRTFCQLSLGGCGFDIGQSVADSVVDTSFVYSTSDTTSTLSFLVAAVDGSGSEGPTSEETPMVTAVNEPRTGPARIALFPVPTRSSVRLHLPADLAGREIAIHDVAGRLVKRWAASGRGNAELIWDGRDDRGVSVPNGVYLVSVSGIRVASIGKIIILH
jgi:hypothetical protein